MGLHQGDKVYDLFSLLFCAGLTAFYMFRLLWLVFVSPSRMEPEAEHHVHESPVSMTSVLVLLAGASAVAGFVQLPHFLEPLMPLAPIPESMHHFETPLLIVSVAIALAGITCAWLLYGRGLERAAGIVRRFGSMHRTLSNKYFIDELYERLLGRPLTWISDMIFLRVGDRMLIDGTLNGLAAMAQRTAGALQRVQTGNLHLYALFVVLGTIVCLVWSFRHG